MRQFSGVASRNEIPIMALSSFTDKAQIRPITILTNLLKAGLFGVVLGYFLALLLGRSVWLEMRFNIGLMIPVCTLACILFSVWKRITIRYSFFLFLELLTVVTFLFVYRFEMDAFLVIPGCLLREGCRLNFVGLGFINIFLGIILFAGNFIWIF
jgi:hypothetical protein